MADLIDAWMQLPNKAYLLDLMFDSLRRWPTAWKSLAQDNPAITHDEALDTLLAQGVTQVIASAWWGPTGPMITNDEVAAAVRAHPRHVVGVASVDVSRPMAGVRELRRCVKQLGFKGLRVLPWLWGLPPDDRRYYPLYAECVELDITFCLQVGHAGPMRPSEPGRPIPYLDNVAHEFPELRIVDGHIGFPWVAEMVSLMMKHPNVYVEPSRPFFAPPFPGHHAPSPARRIPAGAAGTARSRHQRPPRPRAPFPPPPLPGHHAPSPACRIPAGAAGTAPGRFGRELSARWYPADMKCCGP
jgi:predicted TIM-barrel fold metal-dependent hydrolase